MKIPVTPEVLELMRQNSISIGHIPNFQPVDLGNGYQQIIVGDEVAAHLIAHRKVGESFNDVILRMFKEMP